VTKLTKYAGTVKKTEIQKFSYFSNGKRYQSGQEEQTCFYAMNMHCGGSLEHQSVDINDHLGVDSGIVDLCFPYTNC
jgi:hypothetical protein